MPRGPDAAYARTHRTGRESIASGRAVRRAAACVDYTVDYLKTRKQFRQLIGAYQAAQPPLFSTFSRGLKNCAPRALCGGRHCEKQGRRLNRGAHGNAKAEGALA